MMSFLNGDAEPEGPGNGEIETDNVTRVRQVQFQKAIGDAMVSHCSFLEVLLCIFNNYCGVALNF